MPFNSQPQTLLFRSHARLAEVLKLTAVVRDLQLRYPGEFYTQVQTNYPEVWQNNPYLQLPPCHEKPAIEVDFGRVAVTQKYKIQPRHGLEIFHEFLSVIIGMPVYMTKLAADIHFDKAEITRPPLLTGNYWLIITGFPGESPLRSWSTHSYQQVIDYFKDGVRFVQLELEGEVSRVMKGTEVIRQQALREKFRLIKNASGVLCASAAAMHLAAAFEKPCIVLAGGCEPVYTNLYPSQRYLHTIGQLACCYRDACWKSQLATPTEATHIHEDNTCRFAITEQDETLPLCMQLIKPKEVADSIEQYLVRRQLPAQRPARERALTESDCYSRITERASRLAFWDGRSSGRGIVIPGGGVKYFPCAWVCINLLRYLGCKLPVELWHLGIAEMTTGMRKLVEPLDVVPVDAHQICKNYPVRLLGGWELKPYAILHSRFSEVLLLDADNVPVVDPSFLFETPQYQRTGAIFWPDFGRLSESRSIWRLTGVQYRDEPEFESGQIVISKERCWAPLSLTMWMNEHSDFWYQHIHGDKETFHLSWRKLEMNYSMPSRPIDALQGAMCQHDFVGRRIFQHRNLAKWKIGTSNERVSGFFLEDLCLQFLSLLEGKELDK